MADLHNVARRATETTACMSSPTNAETQGVCVCVCGFAYMYTVASTKNILCDLIYSAVESSRRGDSKMRTVRRS